MFSEKGNANEAHFHQRLGGRTGFVKSMAVMSKVQSLGEFDDEILR